MRKMQNSVHYFKEERILKKLAVLALLLCMMFMLSVCALAASGEASAEASDEADRPESVTVEGASITGEIAGWMYTEDDGVLTVIQSPQTVKSEMVVLLPGLIGEKKVDALGNGNAVMSNNKLNGSWVLFPEELGFIASSAIHDFNDTVAWVIPGTVGVSDDPWLSCSGYVITAAGSPAADAAALNGKDVESIDGLAKFTVSAGENGYITPAGTYYLQGRHRHGGRQDHDVRRDDAGICDRLQILRRLRGDQRGV